MVFPLRGHQKTFVGSVTRNELEKIDDQMIRQQALEFFEENTAKTVCRTDCETIGRRLLNLGLVIDNVLGHCGKDKKTCCTACFMSGTRSQTMARCLSGIRTDRKIQGLQRGRLNPVRGKEKTKQR